MCHAIGDFFARSPQGKNEKEDSPLTKYIWIMISYYFKFNGMKLARVISNTLVGAQYKALTQHAWCGLLSTSQLQFVRRSIV